MEERRVKDERVKEEIKDTSLEASARSPKGGYDEKVKDIELPKPTKHFEPTGKTFKLDPKNPFKPTMKQIKEVFQNRIDEEPAIDDNIFTGFLGLNSQAYIIYFIMEQQKQIDALSKTNARCLEAYDRLTRQLEALPEGKQLLQVEDQQKTIDALMAHVATLTNQMNEITKKIKK